MFTKNLNNAFSLAEVLITLGIIAIVAALSIPQILSNVDNQQNVTVLRKVYSDLSTHIFSFNSEYNCNSNFKSCAPEAMDFVHQFANFLIEKQNFEQIKNYMPDNFYIKHYDFYGNQSVSMAWQGGYLLRPKSGAYIISVGQNGPNNLGKAYFNGLPYQSPATNIRSEIVIFTNPSKYYKETARIGKDIFFIFVAENGKLLPGGSKFCYGNGHNCLDYTMYNACNLKAEGEYMANGYGCFQKIIDDGWKIKYR